jgi:predicted GNAT family N-acyltransferase/CRP-like cAMP-binding protein
MPLHIHTLRADAPAFEAVMRLRYEVYAEEEGLNLPDMDHARRTVHDALDAHSLILAAVEGDQVVGTVRWTPLPAFGPALPLHARLALPMWPVDRHRQIVIGRLMVRPSHRGGSVCKRLLKAAYSAALDAGMLLGHVESSPRNLPLYEGIGCRRHGLPYGDPHFGLCVPMVLLLRDRAHLERTGSILRALLPDHLVDARQARRFARCTVVGDVPASVRLRQPAQQDALAAELARTAPALLADLSPDEQRHVLSAATVLPLPADHTWLPRGNMGTEMYVVLKGQVRLSETGVLRPARPSLQVLKAGDVLAEAALLTGRAEPWRWDASAEPDTQVLAFSAASWQGLRRAMPTSTQKVDERLREMVSARTMRHDKGAIGDSSTCHDA